MKATAIAPSNIAFVKYWGKADEKLRLPLNSSISMNLSAAFTTTTVEFQKGLSRDDTTIVGGAFDESECARVSKQMDVIRTHLGVKEFAKVVTQNSFPKSAGAASSASGFAALVMAAAKASEKVVSEKELSMLARIGSGSACRSIPDGFVEWKKGEKSEESYAFSLYPHEYWDLRDILVIVDSDRKKISTSAGMELVRTSPFLQARLDSVEVSLTNVRQALKNKDFELLGVTMEAEAINMHSVMMTQVPPIFYWNSVTMEIIRSVHEWRVDGVEVYFTIDAGPNVHLICEGKNEKRVLEKLNDVVGVKKSIINSPACGAHEAQDHLF